MPEPFCDWCFKGRAEVRHLFESARKNYICDECAELCVSMVEKNQLTREEELRVLTEHASRSRSSSS